MMNIRNRFSTTIAGLSAAALLTIFGLPTLAMAGAGPTAAARPAPHKAQTIPAALRPAFYRALAKDAGPAYALNKEGCAKVTKQALEACFDAEGAHFKGARQLSLHLAAFGRGTKIAPVTAVKPVIEKNQVSYRHDNLTAWWRVLPMGFEQGFTIAKRPAGHGKLTLALTASRQDVGAPPTRHSREGGNTLAWGKLRYGQLVVTDANGKAIPATLTTKDGRILIAVNDAHAAYPLMVDPLVWIEQKVTASDGMAFDEFGSSVALDGTTAIVGAIYGANGNGAAYVFSDSNGTWTQTQELTANDGAGNDQFGYSVAVEGTTALIGTDNDSNADGGEVYVFTDLNGTWTQTQELAATSSDQVFDFGTAVALEDTTALIGAPVTTVNGNYSQGAAFVFTYSDGTWAQTQELTASDGVGGEELGASVALSGTAALIGARYADVGGGTDAGAAYVFNESTGTWTQTQKLTASDPASGVYFGWSVSLDGATALVGAPSDIDEGQGAAYTFSESGGTWSQMQKLTASDGGVGDDFGISVALDGDTALIGAPYIDNFAGEAYVFTESGGTWSETRKFAPTTANSAIGQSVALDGTSALIGAPDTTIAGNSGQGAAYFYGASDLGLALSAPAMVGQGQQYVSQTIATNNSSAASAAVAVTVAVPAAASFISATASEGSCSEASGVVTCDFGAIDGNAGMATANVTLKATGAVGTTIDNTASVVKATPALTASAPTEITEAGACPDGYTEYDGTLNPGEVARSPVYQASGGSENAILTAPERFQLYAVYQSGRFGRHVYLVPGNEVHRWAPKGLYMWLVRARDGAGAYTLCLLHP